MSDPYIKEIIQKKNWIEEATEKNIPSEESLKDISKGMLAHNISCLKDELKVITEERDELYKDNASLDKDVQLYKVEVDQLKIVINDQRKIIADLKRKGKNEKKIY